MEKFWASFSRLGLTMMVIYSAQIHFANENRLMFPMVRTKLNAPLSLFGMGLALLLLIGCQQQSDGPPQYLVSGTVTLANQPIDDGVIIFFPTQQGGGSQSAFEIKAGSFQGTATAGPKRIQIEVKRPGRKFTDEEGNTRTEDDWVSVGGKKSLTYEILPQENRGLQFDLKK